MSAARADVKMAKSSKEDRNKVVAKASEVAGPLLTPSRYVAKLLSGLGPLSPLCKQVGSALAVSISFLYFRSMVSHNPQALTKREVNRHEKDVRVVIVHFDLVRNYSCCSLQAQLPSDP